MFLLGLIAILCAWGMIGWIWIELNKNLDRITYLEKDNKALWGEIVILNEIKRVEEKVDNKALWEEVHILNERMDHRE